MSGCGCCKEPIEEEKFDKVEIENKKLDKTLEELEEADLLLHVVDISNPAFEEQIEAVERILEELELQALERLIVFNKIDAAPEDLDIEAISSRFGAIAVSALDQPSLRPLTERLIAGIAPADRGWRWSVV